MDKNPKFVLGMFQIDKDKNRLLEPTTLSPPKRQISLTTLLALCVATGLTMGAGSAFAKGSLSMDDGAIDQVPWSTKPSQQVEVKPNVSTFERNTTPRNSESDSKEILPVAPSIPSTSNQTTPAYEKKVERAIAESKTKENAPLVSFNKEKIDYSSKKNEQKQNAVSKQSKPLSASSEVKKQVSTSAPAVSTNAPLPKTEQGGALPQTAGHDVEGVMVGVATALMAGWYLVYTRRAQSQ
ncbi:hypothetical protein [Thermoactinomyces sp. DSM 45892]|uniref:hypothetical protein n=1 Tax=Thermoactinomyces sp. DSM 45892 TaxID=1882753 RepID=UPI0008970623|nr:hypothetical protein [Thermoactinomyces sp. DSM 45892]SDZ28698.1 hypothetical protein SAMN05444416_11923 [Thermoactinomyces sp. DSM 45892]